jgi:hypothetical protein
MSRALCDPRYDFADLTTARAAWAEALTRVHALGGSSPWTELYPENERFWLSDALALAQRLGAVDDRRGRLELDADGILGVTGPLPDPLVLWNDLRGFYLGRRLARRGATGLRYPETTIDDVRQVAHLIGDAVTTTRAEVIQRADLVRYFEATAKSWWRSVEAVNQAVASSSPHETYFDNAGFWLRDARRAAMRMSVLREAATSASTWLPTGDAS